MKSFLDQFSCIKTKRGCMECNLSPDGDGYPRKSINGKLSRIHRIVYEFYHGKVEDGRVVRHKCDNPKCINPKHLVVGTQAENMMDMRERGRHRGCALPGTKNSNCLLNTRKVRDIKERSYPAAHYAEKYKVSRKTIYAIWEGSLWKNVA